MESADETGKWEGWRECERVCRRLSADVLVSACEKALGEKQRRAMKGTLQYCKFAASSGVNGAAHSIKMTEGRELRHTEWTCAQSQWCLSAEDVPDWPFLATYLISEASKGKDSPWYSYISALPKKPESILLWSETETRNYLFASSIMNQALERIAEVENTFDSKDSSIYKKHSQLFPSETSRDFWPSPAVIL
ncbi:hypothetical protein L7F22_022088 [Adiantum nelumboides]|nr:hypothetical protein [Adiantum nelumboides]